MNEPKDDAADEPTNAQRVLRIARTLPSYVFHRERGGIASPGSVEADQCTEEDLRDLICDALHFARSRGFEPGEIMADAALNFSAEEEGAADDARGEQADPSGTGASIDRAFNMPGETGEFATGSDSNEPGCQLCGAAGVMEGESAPDGHGLCAECAQREGVK